MGFGVAYTVVGSADCPYFARAERLAKLVQHTLGLHEDEIQINMIPPSNWSSHLTALCRSLGFSSFLSECLSMHPVSTSFRSKYERVLIYNHRTCRLIGGEKAFRKEVTAKYGVEVDEPWSAFQSIAKENGESLQHHQRIRVQYMMNRPRMIALIGCVRSGMARRLERSCSMMRISSADLLRQAIQEAEGIWEARSSSMVGNVDGQNQPSIPFSTVPFVDAPSIQIIRDCMRDGELVPDRIMLPLLSARLQFDDVRGSSNVKTIVLDGWPRTADQAKLIADLAQTSAPALNALICLDGLSEAAAKQRVESERIDPVTGEIFNLNHDASLPTSGMVLARLTKRKENGSDDLSSPAGLRRFHTLYRSSMHAREEFAQLYGRPLSAETTINLLDPSLTGTRVTPLYSVNATGDPSNIWQQILDIVQPLLQKPTSQPQHQQHQPHQPQPQTQQVPSLSASSSVPPSQPSPTSSSSSSSSSQVATTSVPSAIDVTVSPSVPVVMSPPHVELVHPSNSRSSSRRATLNRPDTAAGGEGSGEGSSTSRRASARKSWRASRNSRRSTQKLAVPSGVLKTEAADAVERVTGGEEAEEVTLHRKRVSRPTSARSRPMSAAPSRPTSARPSRPTSAKPNPEQASAAAAEQQEESAATSTAAETVAAQ